MAIVVNEKLGIVHHLRLKCHSVSDTGSASVFSCNENGTFSVETGSI